MHVIDVVPIIRGTFTDQLSFFAKEPLAPGMVVDVPIRNKKTAALVIASKDARTEKTNLKHESFSLKKLEPKHARRVFLSHTIEAVREAAQYHGAHIGTALAYFSPSTLVNSENTRVAPASSETFTSCTADALVLQAEYEERVIQYRNTAREAFAKGESVIVLTPTIPEAERVYGELSRGIEEQTILLTSALTKKATMEMWNRAVSDPEPVLIVMTHSFLTIPRPHVHTLFVERESARSYVGMHAPYFDARVTAEKIARKQGTRIVFADFPARIETHARLRAHDLDEFSRVQSARRSGAPVRVIDVRSKDTFPETEKKKTFSPLAPHVRNVLEKHVPHGARAFIHAARRGVAPLTLCNDCGTPVTDPATGAPMTLHKTEKGNVFLSFRSGALIPAHTACTTCGGWNLVSLGIGAVRVYDEVARLMLDTPLFLFTTETATSPARAKKIIREFYATPGAILVGTDKVLPYLAEPIEYTVVTSLDSMLSAPAWRADTHTLHTLFYIADRTSETMFVQTRIPESRVVRAIASGNPTDCIEEELQTRRDFGYPPFYTFIALTWTGTEATVKKIAAHIADVFHEYELVGPLPARALSKTKYVGRAVLRREKGTWPDPALATLLMSLPQDVAVTIDPDDIV
jgi:primosomal protein N'